MIRAVLVHRWRRVAPMIVGAALAFGITAPAQEEPTFRTHSNVVLVPALVRDKSGSVVYGLKSSDFIIEDDGVPQKVRLDEAAESEPISIVVAVQVGRRADLNKPGYAPVRWPTVARLVV
jgi:hypothetical protein